MRYCKQIILSLVVLMVLSIVTPVIASYDFPTEGEGGENEVGPPDNQGPRPDPTNPPPPSPNPPSPPQPSKLQKPQDKKGGYSNEPNPAQKFEDVYRGLNLVGSQDVEREKVELITKETSKTKPRKFENPDDLMSRSEFLMAMIQAKKIIEGRKVLNYVRYTRYNGPLNTYQVIESEPVEDSGYLEYMGGLGLDAGTTDIALNHGVLGTNKIISNPNVIELYLVEAFQKGLIKMDELDTKPGGDAESLKVFLENTYQKVGAKAPEPKDKVSVRWDTFHGPVVFGLPIDSTERIGKLFEHDNAEMGQYPQALQPTKNGTVDGEERREKFRKDEATGIHLYKSKWDHIVTKAEYSIKDKESWFENSAFWGSSYMYIHNKKKLTTSTGFESLAKFDVYPANIIQLFTGEQLRDTTRGEKEELQIIRRQPRIINPNGFAFFLNENITLLEAYQYAAKYLKALDNETDLSKDTIDVINSAYGVNTSSMTPEEAEAVNFLIALGVVDGEDTSLYNAFQLPLTNRRAVDLIYKIKFPDARKKTLPTLTELDKAMLEKGFGKVSINVDDNVKEFPITYVDEPVDSDDPQTAEDIIRETMSKPEGKGEYELLAIRYPSVEENSGRRRYWGWKNVKTFKLMVNDQYRTEIPYQQINSNEFSALEDGSGGYWRIYTVHKDTVSDLKLVVQVDENNETKSYTFTGISGPGLYWIDEDSNQFNIRKWKFEEITQDDKSNDKSKDSPIATYLKEKDRQKGFEFIKKLKDIRTRLSMYYDDNASFNISLRDGLRRLQVNAPFSVEQNEDFYAKLIQTGTYSVEDVARLARIQSGKLNNDATWVRPTYAEQAKDLVITRGGMTLAQLKNTKYGGEPLIVMNGDKPEINKENNVFKTMGITDRVTLEEVQIEDADGNPQTVYDIKYRPKSKDLKTESAKFFQYFSENVSAGAKKFGGYAKLNGENGETLTLISKEELGSFGIQALSDKVLFNPTTGQRAFLNTDDNLTMIGNNITQYKDGHVIVNAFGAIARDEKGNPTEGRDESKIFYNLDIILELINDTDLVSRRAGKNIFVGVKGDKFEQVEIRNTEDGAKNRHPVIDITYKYNNSNFSDDTFVNLSAMAGITSNFIFYKDRRGGSTDNEALIVYKPMEDYVAYTGEVDNSLKRQMIAGSPTQNSMYDILSTAFPFNDILSLESKCKSLSGGNNDECNHFGYNRSLQTIRGYKSQDGTLNTAFNNYTTDMEKRNALVKHLFVGSTGYDDIFPPGYTFKLFILNRVNSEESRKTTFNNFYNNMALNLSINEYDKFFNDIGEKLDYTKGYIDDAEVQKYMDNDNEYYKHTAEKSVGGLYAAVLDVATSPVQAGKAARNTGVNQFDLMVHDASGNLYMSLGKEGTQSRAKQLKRYQFMFENNIFLVDKAQVLDSNGKPVTKPQIYFKPRHVYENTPRNSIPLEVYADGDGYFGGMFLDGGRRMVNFEKVDNSGKPLKEKKFKLSNVKYASNTAINKYNDNGEYTGNPGMFTKLSADPIVLDFSWAKDCNKDKCSTTAKKPKSLTAYEFKKVELEDKDMEFKVDKKGEDKDVGINMMKYLFWKSMEEFDKHFSENKEKGPAELSIYNAIFGARVRPDEKDWKFMMKSMTHSWGYNKTRTLPTITTSYDLSDSLNESNNYDLSSAGLKEGDNVVFLTVGLPKEFQQIANSKQGIIKDYGTEDKYQVYMVKDKVIKVNDKLTLSNAAYYFFNGNTWCKNEDKDCIEIKERVKPLVNMSDLKEFTNNYELKVMFLPSISVPYGTTLVNREGYPVFLPNEGYREEVQYATNMTNGLIYRMRMHDNSKEGRQFLYQLPKGAVVKFGDSAKLIKASPQQSDENKLKWVEMITSTENSMKTVSWYEASDYANLDWFLRGYANRVMIDYNTSNSKVSLKSIVGKGMYNVPAADLITETINSLDRSKSDLDVQKSGRHFRKPMWVNDLNRGGASKFIIDPVIATKEDGSGSEFPQGKIIPKSTEESRNGDQAKIVLLLYLPPTIEVEPVKNGVQDAHYNVLMYHDIRQFVVDPDDSYVQYMRDRDTNAEELLKNFEQIQIEELDGRKYLSSAKNKLSQIKINNILGTIERVAPIILMAIVFLIWIFYLGLQIPITQKLIIRLSMRFNMGLGTMDEYGNIDPRSLPSFVYVFIITVAFATVAILIDSGILVKFIIKMLDFFKYIIDSRVR